MVGAAGALTVACGKTDPTDFVSELAALLATGAEGLALAADGAAEILGEPAAGAGVGIVAFVGAAAAGKRMPQKPATGSVNSSST